MGPAAELLPRPMRAMRRHIQFKASILILTAGLLASPLAAQTAPEPATSAAAGAGYAATDAAPAAGAGLTLQQAVAAALERNPAMKLAAAEMASSRAGLRLSRAPLLPQIQFSENLTRSNDPVYAFGSKLRQQVFQNSDFSLQSLNHPEPLTDFNTTVSGRWTAFDSLRTRYQMRRASFLNRSAEASADRTSQEVIYRVVNAYESVLIATRNVEVATHAADTAQALYAESRSRVNAGLAVESDALSAQVNLATRQQELTQAQGDEQTAWAELEAAVGTPLPAGPASLAPLADHSFPAAGLADEVDTAFRSRPDLKSLALATSAQQAGVKSARSDFGPRVDAYGSWAADRHSFAGEGGAYWTAGAELRVDVLPFEKQYRLQQEKASLLRAQAGEESARNAIRVEVSRAYYGLQSAAKVVDLARDSRAQATESLRILRNRYDAGLTTLTDVLRAEDAERQSQTNYWQAVYRHALGYAALRLATGTLSEDQMVNFQ
jgi:outer membrane protein